jgi:hypothetical protein
MESGYAYPERSADNPAETCENVEAETGVRTKNNIMALAEVSRGHSKPATSRIPKKRASAEASQKDEGLNVRMAKQSGRLWQSDNNRNTSANYLYEDRAEPESKIKEELSQATQPMRTTPGRKSFLVVCLKKY